MQYNCPYNYPEINAQAGFYSPSSVKPYNNKTFAYWCRALLMRLCSVFDVENFESEYFTRKDIDYLFYNLFYYGFVTFFNSDEFGFTFQRCTLRGYDWHYQPTNALVTHPLLKTDLDLKIGKDCEIVRLNTDYCGVWDIIEYYAEKLCTIDIAVDTSIINSKFSYIVAGKTKAETEALKKAMDEINRGNPAVFMDKLQCDPKNDPFILLERTGLKNNFILPELLAAHRDILDKFNAEIGIPNVPREKKERLIVDEIKNQDTSARATIELDTMNGDLQAVNEMFGKNLKIVYNYEQDVNGGVDVENDAVRRGEMEE